MKMQASTTCGHTLLILCKFYYFLSGLFLARTIFSTSLIENKIRQGKNFAGTKISTKNSQVQDKN